jgi:hypothetical protein
VGNSSQCNQNGVTYVAYLFAHNAGGFGLTGTDNVISCGSYTGTGAAGNTITLGYEPQWILAKASSSAQSWQMFDVMRGMPVGSSNDSALYPNLSNAEAVNENGFSPTATGFVTDGSNNNLNGVNYIYIAIRRGPMKTPTTGTSVFAPLAVNNATGTVNTTNFPVDLQMQFYRPGGINPGTSQWIDRLRGFSSTSTDSGTRLYTTGTNAEAATAIGTLFNNTGFSTGASWNSASMSYNNFQRAPGFFDEVCYTGTGSGGTGLIAHNLTVAPELVIIKPRSSGSWECGTQFTSTQYIFLLLDGTNGFGSRGYNTGYGDYSAAPTATNVNVLANGSYNSSGINYVAYLFATCPGVSKVGSYTGTGTTQTINCGFAAGSRFVMIKRTDSTGDWYVWDSARGIVAGNDPYLLLNSTAAEVTGTDYIDTAATGFEITSTAPAAINASGGTFIYLAIS